MPVVDPTKMYLFFGGLGEHRTVSIVSVRKTSLGGSLPPVECTKAIRGKVSWRILQMLSAAYVKPECMYSIPYALAPGPWKPGDTLTDATQVDATSEFTGVTYTVQLAEVDEGFWLLYCFNPKTSFFLEDVGSILVTTETITSGIRTITAAVIYSGLRCRIQPVDTGLDLSQGRVADRKVFDVFVADDLNLQPSKHLFQWTEEGTGFLLTADILEVTQRESIADLMRLRVEVRAAQSGTT